MTTQQTKNFGERVGSFVRANLSWLLGAALALLLIQDVFGTHGLIAMRRSMREAADTQRTIDRLNQDNQQLEDHVKALKSDPAAIERIAREEMGLARPGEYIFKVTPKDASTISQTAPANKP
jgi:cell division protein FtsB